MKCLLVADLHYTLKQFDWLLSVADRFDLVVVAGDVLDISSALPLNAQLTVVMKYLKRISERGRLLVCSGNHDLTARDAAGEKAAAWMDLVRRLQVPCDGDRLTVDGYRISIFPWWDGPQGRDRVAAQLAVDAERSDDRWIWVYHAPPDDSPVSWAGKRHYGDRELLGWMERYRPELVLCGHIHQAPFKREGSWVDRIGHSWVFNAGRQIGPVPTHIVIDTDSRQATWLSLAGVERVKLDCPLQRPLMQLE